MGGLSNGPIPPHDSPNPPIRGSKSPFLKLQPNGRSEIDLKMPIGDDLVIKAMRHEKGYGAKIKLIGAFRSNWGYCEN